MRTCVRVTGGIDPARRRRFVLRLGRAAGRSAPARTAGDRRPRGGDGGKLRGQGLRGALGDGRRAGPAAVPAGRLRRAALARLRGREQGAVRALRAGRAPGRGTVDGGGVPRRQRTATDLRLADRDRRAAEGRRARADRPADHGRDRDDEVPRQGRQRRRQARRAAAGRARVGARVPASAAGRAALGRRPGDRGQAAPPRGHHGPRDRAAQRGRAGLDARPGRRAAISTRSPTTATRGGCGRGGGAARSGRSRRSGAGRGRSRRSTGCSSRSWTGSAGGCGPPGASAAR